jgi:hypothetical protein
MDLCSKFRPSVQHFFGGVVVVVGGVVILPYAW